MIALARALTLFLTVAFLPPIVFVSRVAPRGADSLAVPGLGPGGRTLAPGGRLLVREPGGALRELAPGRFFDASHPSVSPDGRRVAFAAIAWPRGRWRIWRIGTDGRDLAPALADTTGGGAAGDDFDPCWVDDSTLCFASTRAGERAQYGGVSTSNLYIARLGAAARRLTWERNGAESPAMDFARGRILFARWWHNRWLADAGGGGVTLDRARAAPGESVSVWHAMEITPAGGDERLACGTPVDRARARLGGMAYSPAVLADGSIVAVYAANEALVPAPGGTGLQRFAPRLGPGRRLAGALVDPSARAGYGAPSGLAAPSACAPAALPDGRVLFAYDPGGRGDFGLWVARPDGGGLARVLDLPGTLELDPAPVVARGRAARVALPGPGAPGLPPATLAALLARPHFRYLDLDVFARARGPGGDSAAAPRVAGGRIRFFAALSRPDDPGGDTAVLLREVAIGPRGRVDVRDLPAGVPLFEQLVGPEGSPLRSAHGPAHVAGLNVGAAGATVRCSGCHAGHSLLLRR